MTERTQEIPVEFVKEKVAIIAAHLGFDQVVLIGRTRCDGIGGKETRDRLFAYGRDDDDAVAADFLAEHIARTLFIGAP